MKFKEIKAKVCPNEKCKQIIPEEMTSCYNDEWCPKCGYGMTEKRLQEIRNRNRK
ncbi:hypothetical protein U8V72_21010 [Priestia filamentosa]|uniref:hypothetical protein n=1 Tax=Priestia filamentosa TaxID=1402861 RepID=UPI000ACEE0E3